MGPHSGGSIHSWVRLEFSRGAGSLTAGCHLDASPITCPASLPAEDLEDWGIGNGQGQVMAGHRAPADATVSLRASLPKYYLHVVFPIQ